VRETEDEVVMAFNEAINSRDLERLSVRMSPDHRFVDSAGQAVLGKEACRAAWASFFEAFPDYRNVFDRVMVEAPGQVVADGRSECATEALSGPARWRATVADGLVVEWRVEGRGADWS
jgi:ketosteroid isomerase-like protein